MSKKSFKVSKSLYLNPINLATILDPQDGELAIDINDSNKLKKYSTTSSTWVEVGSGGGGGSTTLDGLTDVTISSVQDGQILVYNSATSQWENQTIVVEETVTEVTILNNQSTPVNTGITFLYPAVKSFELFGHIIRTTSTGEKSEAIKILGIYHTSTSSWEITDTAVGNSGVVFSITAGGNLQYTSDNMSGVSYVGVFKYGYKANGGDKNFVSSALVTQPDSDLRISGAAVASGKKYWTFTNIQSNIGNRIQYIKDAVNGDKFIALEDGEYSFSATVGGSVASAQAHIAGLVKNFDVVDPYNDAGLINALLAASEYAGTSSAGNPDLEVSWSGQLKKNDYIKLANFHSAYTGYNTLRNIMQMSSVGSTKILNPSSDQKVDIPTHELRFEGASSRGSTDTAIVKFDTLAKIKGDGFTVVNTAANGTVVTIKKAGKLDVSTSFGLSANNNCYLTKNSTQLTGQPTIASDIMGFSSSEANGLQFVNMNWSGEVSVGDIIRVHATANPSNSSSSLNLVLQEKSVAVALQNVAPRWDNSDSAVELQNGSYSVALSRFIDFSNVLNNVGVGITYTANPSTFTVNEDGNYNISAMVSFAAAGGDVAIVKNSPNINQSYKLLPTNQILDSVTASGANYRNTLAANTYLFKGDTIRIQTENSPSLGSTAEMNFRITKVGKTQGTVDVTPFVNVPQNEVETIEFLTASGAFGSTNTGVVLFSSPDRFTNKGVLRIVSTAADGSYLEALQDCTANISVTFEGASTNAKAYITRNSTSLVAGAINGVVSASTQAGAGYETTLNASVSLLKGDKIRIQRVSTTINFIDRVLVTATASSSSIISQTDQVSSDTISLAFKPTAIVDSDPVGTFNTYLYTANTNTAVIQATAPTQTIADMNVNGIRVYARPFNSAGTVGLPSRVDIKIGKGLKNFKLLGYANTGKTGDFSFDRVIVSSTDERGLSYSYSEATGILSLNAGSCYMSSTTTRYIDAFAGLTNGYFAFNASKTASLITVPNLQPRIAVIQDVKASGTAGGTFTSAAFQTRVLNTLSDPSGIVTSLASNQFTLPAGQYLIEASAPVYEINFAALRLRNITDGTTALRGQVSSAPVGAGTSSILDGIITINNSKTFELQHYCTLTKASDGFGVAVSDGEDEVYAQVKITKIK